LTHVCLFLFYLNKINGIDSSSIDITANDGGNSSIPIAFYTASSLQLYEVASVVEEYDGTVYFGFKVVRSITTRIFSMFIVFVMWMISLIKFFTALSFWLLKKKIELPLLALSGALLFGLPALRNSQPGVPPIGVMADVFGFFWNQMLIALTSIFIFAISMSYNPG
jgi:hypothetical protein